MYVEQAILFNLRTYFNRIWDWFFYDGSIVLFQLTLGMLKLKEPELKDLENSAQIFNSLSDIPGDIDDVDALFDISMEVGGVSGKATIFNNVNFERKIPVKFKYAQNSVPLITVTEQNRH